MKAIIIWYKHVLIKNFLKVDKVDKQMNKYTNK